MKWSVIWLLLLFSGVSKCLSKKPTKPKQDEQINESLTSLKKTLNILDTSKYQKIKEIISFLKKLSKLAPDSMSLESIGDTAIKGKPFKHHIYLITIGKKKDPIIWFDCGIHAREWISPAVCNYLIQELVVAFEAKRKNISNQNTKKMEEIFNYQWMFIPLLNPDGYMTTHFKDLSGEKIHRMHRKNRRPCDTMNISKTLRTICDDEGNCEGIDLNRNFPGGYGLGHPTFEEDSKKPWTSVYKGSHPLSEPETVALHRRFEKIKDKVLLAASIHSYGKDIYYPKGWLSADHEEQIKGKERDYLRDFAEYFNKALDFRIGSVAEILQPEELCGGATDDYYYTSGGINLTYTIELDPEINLSSIGFQLPPEEIKPVGDRMWKAINLMAEKLTLLYPQYKKESNKKKTYRIRI